MKARIGPPKDYEDIRAKVAEASKLMAGGLSEAKAAKSVGLPRSSLQRYIQNGMPNLGLPNLPKSTLPKVKNCQEDLAGVNRDAPSCLPRNLSRPSGMFLGNFCRETWQAL